jgi:hypothetical protein
MTLNDQILQNFQYDRLIGDVLQLPFDFELIKIKANEEATADTINLSLSALHQNFLYLISRSNLINTLTSAISSTSALFAYFISAGEPTSIPVTVFNKSALPINSSNLVAYGTDKLSATDVDATIGDYLVLTTSFYNESTNSSFLNFAVSPISANGFEPFYNLTVAYTEISPVNTINKYKRISHIKSHNDSLYVLDSGNNTVYCYDLTTLKYAYSLNSSSTTSKIKLTNNIGNYGTARDLFGFSNPISFDVGSKFIVVCDTNSSSVSSNYCFKVYDLSLQWLYTSPQRDLWLSESPIDVAISPDNFVYFLTPSGKVHIYNDLFQYVQTIQLTDNLQSNFINENQESYNTISFAENIDNVVYVGTNLNIYKKFISRIDKNILKFSDAGFITGGRTTHLNSNNTAFNDGELVANLIALPSQNSNIFCTEIIRDKNTFSYASVSAFQDNLQATYPPEDFLIKYDEFNTSFVLNKALYKLCYNNLALNQEIGYTFLGSYDLYGNLNLFSDKQYVASANQNLHSIGLDNFVGINEFISSAVINRCLESVYNYQSAILNKLQTKKTNVFPDPYANTILTNYNATFVENNANNQVQGSYTTYIPIVTQCIPAPNPTPTGYVTPTAASPTPTRTTTPTPTPTITPNFVGTLTPTPTVTPTMTPSATVTPTPTTTPAVIPPTPTNTPTPTPTPSPALIFNAPINMAWSFINGANRTTSINNNNNAYWMRLTASPAFSAQFTNDAVDYIPPFSSLQVPCSDNGTGTVNSLTTTFAWALGNFDANHVFTPLGLTGSSGTVTGQATRTTLNTGGGGGCPAAGQIIQTFERGFIEARELKVGMHLKDAKRGRWNKILFAEIRQADIYRIEIGEETFDVDESHLWPIGNDVWKAVNKFVTGDTVENAKGEFISVGKVENLGRGDYMHLTVERNIFQMGTKGIIGHNFPTPINTKKF